VSSWRCVTTSTTSTTSTTRTARSWEVAVTFPRYLGRSLPRYVDVY
jgi:hypothetical protein